MYTRRMMLVTLGALAGLAVAPAGCSSGGGLAGKTAAQVLAAANAAGSAKGSVRLTQTNSLAPQAVSVFDIGRTEGREVDKGPGGSGTLLVFPGVAYLSGDAAFLTGNSVPKTAAPSYAGRWVSVSPSSAVYYQLIDGETLASLAQESPTGALKLTKETKVDGRKVIGVTGGPPPAMVANRVSGNETVYITESSPHLVIEAIVNGTPIGGAHFTITSKLTNWGESLHLTAPTGATPLTSIK